MKKQPIFVSRYILITGLVALTIVIMSACSNGDETDLVKPTAATQITPSVPSDPQDEPVTPTVFSSSPLSESSSPIASPNDLDDSSTQYEIAMILASQIMQLGNYREAIVQYDKATELFPKKAVPYDARGSAHYLLSEYDQALTDYNRAIELDENYATAYYNRGRLLLQSGNYEDALQDLNKSIALNPDEFSYRANGNIGIIYYRQSEYNKAIKAFDAAIVANDTNADTYFLRGNTYAAMGNYPAAITDYQSAIARYAGYAEAYQGLGYAHYKAKQLGQAEAALQMAINNSPNLPQSQGYLALVRLAQNDETGATNALNQTKTLLTTLPVVEQKSITDMLLDELTQFGEVYPDQKDAADRLRSLLSE